MAGLLTGLPSLMSFVRKDHCTMEYCISGWDLLKQAEIRFVTKASIIAHVSDAALELLFKDSRFARICEEVQAAVVQEAMLLDGGCPCIFGTCSVGCSMLTQR